MSHWALLVCDKDNSNQQLHRACTRGPLQNRTSVVHRTWRRCCFSSPPRLIFGTGVDCCDDSVGHKRGCHLVALWAFKGGGNWCRYDLSLSRWVVSSPLAIGWVNNLTQRCSCWCSMHMTIFIHYKRDRIIQWVLSYIIIAWCCYYSQRLTTLKSCWWRCSTQSTERIDDCRTRGLCCHCSWQLTKRPTHVVAMASIVTVPYWLLYSLLLTNNGMLLSFGVIDNSFNKLINQLQSNLLVIYGWHS